MSVREVTVLAEERVGRVRPESPSRQVAAPQLGATLRAVRGVRAKVRATARVEPEADAGPAPGGGQEGSERAHEG